MAVAVGLVAAFAAYAWLALTAKKDRAPRKPNFVFIILDKVRHDNMLEFARNYPRAMPYWTSLKNEGTVFENAITPDSWTLPSHLEFLSGRDLGNFRKVEKTYTLAAHLRKNGYLCVAILDNPALNAKKSTFHEFEHIQAFTTYHNMQDLMDDPDAPILRFVSYEEFLEYQGAGVLNSSEQPCDAEKWKELIRIVTEGERGLSNVVWPDVRKSYRETGYLEFRYGNLVDLLRDRQDERPVFLFANLIKYVPEQIVSDVKAKWLAEYMRLNYADARMSEEDLDFLPQEAQNYLDVVEGLFTEEMGRLDMRFSVMLFDAILEDLIGFLERNRIITENDYLFISTDHGYTYGEKYPHGKKGAAMYRHAGELVLPVVHSFILAKGPGFEPGLQTTAWASVSDVYRTIVDLVPEDFPEDYFNDYTTKNLRDRIGAAREVPLVFTQSESQTTNVFYKGHKLRWKIGSKDEAALTRWPEDPFEDHDLSQENPELLKEMKKIARSYWYRREEIPAYTVERTEKESTVSPETIQTLRGLGYLE